MWFAIWSTVTCCSANLAVTETQPALETVEINVCSTELVALVHANFDAVGHLWRGDSISRRETSGLKPNVEDLGQKIRWGSYYVTLSSINLLGICCYWHNQMPERTERTERALVNCENKYQLTPGQKKVTQNGRLDHEEVFVRAIRQWQSTSLLHMTIHHQLRFYLNWM